MKRVFLFHVVLSAILLFPEIGGSQNQSNTNNSNTWKRPSQDILDVMYAPQLPWVWTSPTGEYLLLADPIFYPELEELAAPMHKLAGIRVNPKNNYYHGDHGGTSPRLKKIADGIEIPLSLPEGAELQDVDWTVDGQRYALTVDHGDHIGLWVGDVSGKVRKIEGLSVNPLMGNSVSWLPDQKRLVVKRIPKRGPVPDPPLIPAGPKIMEGEGASARSTYEARNLLETAYDDVLFDYFMRAEIVVLDPSDGKTELIGKAGPYSYVRFSPDGQYILVRRLVGPWSHEVAYWRFAHEVEVWDAKGNKVSTVASLPLADNVPVHGVPTGPRSVQWRSTAPHTLYWIEALDGGNPVTEVPHRDQLMRLEAPFNSEAELVYKAEHRMWTNGWTEKGNTVMIAQWQRIKRWRYFYLLDVSSGEARKWYDLDEDDRYNSPGSPVYRQLDNGQWVLRQKGDQVYFRGSGATEDGDRPFLDLRSMKDESSVRLFRCAPDKYEYFVDFAGDEDHFVMRSESPSEVPNYYMATLGKPVDALQGEAGFTYSRRPITDFKDPTPQLRQIEKRIVHYQRKDSVPLSFHLYLPPGYKEGTTLPTVLDAYPLEYSSSATAGQVSGSTRRFMRLYGASNLYFLLKGYAVLANTAMPMIGDPETTYNTFIEQLGSDAEAAVNKAVELGVTDPKRIGVIGHSHGALMVANLLAHTDLFAAGIARSGSYNKTNQPFGFQSERRSLFEARDVYIQVSPTFFADKVNEPVLIIHGDDDSNPGTLTFQSEVFYEAVRGSGGTARLVLLPHEDHGYSAKQNLEHVLWEEFEWFDKYVKKESKME